MKIFKNRIVIGIVCIVVAFAIAFGVAPLASKMMDERVQVVRLRLDVPKGSIISEDNIEVVEVGGYNLPGNLICDKEMVIGKYAASDLYDKDYLTVDKLTDKKASAGNVLESCDYLKAISITVPSYAAGLSGKLENGDIVSVVVYKDDKTFIPKNLRAVRVVTVTTSEGVDKDETEEEIKPATVSFFVTMQQARELVLYENTSKIHLVLVKRDTDWNENYLIQEDLDDVDPYYWQYEEDEESSENDTMIDENGGEIFE